MSGDDMRRPALLREEHKTLENLVVLYLSHAFLRLISPNLRAIAADVRPDRLVVHSVLAEDSSETREDIEDALGDLDALLYNERLPDDWRIDSQVYIGDVDDSWPGVMARRVYEAKPEVP